jgi:hypothetical protein
LVSALLAPSLTAEDTAVKPDASWEVRFPNIECPAFLPNSAIEPGVFYDIIKEKEKIIIFKKNVKKQNNEAKNDKT